MIAYCGLVCTECKGYLLTQSGDMAALEALAAETRAQFGDEGITAESIMCHGCLAESEIQCGYCAMCDVRRCAVERGVETCAHCADYGCAFLQDFWQMAPSTRARLEEIRRSL
jgi:hypothetical protein